MWVYLMTHWWWEEQIILIAELLMESKRTRSFSGFNTHLHYIFTWNHAWHRIDISKQSYKQKPHYLLLLHKCMDFSAFFLALLDSSANLTLSFLLSLFFIDLQPLKQITALSLYYKWFLHILKPLMLLLICKGTNNTTINDCDFFWKREEPLEFLPCAK